MKSKRSKQAIKFVKHFANIIVKTVVSLQDYFKNGSFGVAVYPFLMHPCISRSSRALLTLIAILASFTGVYYLFAELVVILFSEDALEAYFKHTTLELLTPLTSEFSPLSNVMQSVFNLQAIAFWLIFLVVIMQLSRHKYWLLSMPLALFFTIGMMLILNAQGKMTEGGLQNFGLSLTYLMGNLAILFVGIEIKLPHLRSFRIFSLQAGFIGATCILITLFYPNSLMPVLERCGIYSIIIWEILAGFALLKRK